MKNSICIIGARQGSKRLPGKNRLHLGGKPLINYTLEAAQNSNLFNTIIFSTDDEVLLNSIPETEDLVINDRPSELADDKTTLFEVANYLIKEYKNYFNSCASICFITPCHPFRTANHLKEAYHLFINKECNSVISVTPYPTSINFSLRLENGYIKKDWEGGVRKSEHPTTYYPNGALAFVKKHFFIENKSTYSRRTIPYIIPWPYSLDLDYEEDYLLAQKLIRVL